MRKKVNLAYQLSEFSAFQPPALLAIRNSGFLLFHFR